MVKNTDDRIWYKRPIVYIISVLVVIAGVIVINLPRLNSLIHPFRCNSTSTITRTNYQATNGFFIDNQVIVIGPKDNVDAVIHKLANPDNPDNPDTPKVELILAEGCDLSYLNTRKLRQVAVPSPTQIPQVTVPVPTQTLQVGQSPQGAQTLELSSPSTVETQEETNSLYTNPNLSAEQRQSLEMRLYEIPHGSNSTESVINRINREGNGVVFADPNYIVSLLDEDAGLCGRPYAGGGSPYAGGGSPYAGGGSTDAGPGISSINVGDEFMRQWAFDQSGINLPSSPEYKGSGVVVGVFDTSPFRKAYFWFPHKIQIAQPRYLKLAPRNAMGPDPISNHGLFVSGLIHAIAPKSEIKLIRVLNDNGCGNLWEIDTALQNFISRQSAWNLDLNKVVINLSLGLHIPDATHIQRTQGPSDSQHVDWDQIQGDLDKLHAHSFEETIHNAYGFGAVIVAAAGNDSAPPLDMQVADAEEMQTPASYPDVIGVAATTLDGDRACYSNKGDVAAPGGNGGLKIVKKPDGTHRNFCAPRTVTWDLEPEPGLTTDPANHYCNNNMASCDFGVMSLLIVPDKSGRWKYDYGLWSGTSFSTPLVSGLAALDLERSIGNQVEAICRIEKGVSDTLGRSAGVVDPGLGWGIIDVSKSIDPDFNPAPSDCPPLPSAP